MLYCRCQLNFTFNFRCVNQFELKGTIITRYWQTICEMFFFLFCFLFVGFIIITIYVFIFYQVVCLMHVFDHQM